MLEKSKFFSADKPGVVIDLGFAYTKIGFVNENIPKKILPTPKSLFKSAKDLDRTDHRILRDVLEDENLKFELENFLTAIFFNELLVNPKDRSIFIPCSSFLPPLLLSQLSSILLLRLEVPRLYLLPSNPLPLYSTGLFSGIILDCGFLKTLISVIYDGFMVGSGKVAENCGGRRISQKFREGLAEDNPEKKRNWNGEYELIENIKFKAGFVPLRKQWLEYNGSEGNIEKMKKSFIEYSIEPKDSIKVSYYTRICAGNSLFGNPEAEECNLAYDLLKIIKEMDGTIRKKVIQNIILSGGTCQMRNFARRLRQEMVEFLEKDREFESLLPLKDSFLFTNIIYPPNCLNFIGASLIGSLPGSEKFGITAKQYMETYDKTIPDRMGIEFFMVPDYKAEQK